MPVYFQSEEFDGSQEDRDFQSTKDINTRTKFIYQNVSYIKQY